MECLTTWPHPTYEELRQGYVGIPKPRNRLTTKSGTTGLSPWWLDKTISLASFAKIIAVICGVALLRREAVCCCEHELFQTGRACGRICLLPGGFISTNLAETETSLICYCAEPVLKCYLKRALLMSVIADSELWHFSMQQWLLHLASAKCSSRQTRPPTLVAHPAQLAWHGALLLIGPDLHKKGNPAISAWDPKSIPPCVNYIYIYTVVRCINNLWNTQRNTYIFVYMVC